MKHLLLTTIAAVVLVGCGPSETDHALLDAAEAGNIEVVKKASAAGEDVDDDGPVVFLLVILIFLGAFLYHYKSELKRTENIVEDHLEEINYLMIFNPNLSLYRGPINASLRDKKKYRTQYALFEYLESGDEFFDKIKNNFTRWGRGRILMGGGRTLTARISSDVNSFFEEIDDLYVGYKIFGEEFIDYWKATCPCYIPISSPKNLIYLIKGYGRLIEKHTTNVDDLALRKNEIKKNLKILWGDIEYTATNRYKAKKESDYLI